MTEYDIFFSYSKSDVESVEKVAEYLSDAGVNVWLDKWSLIPGDSWTNEIESVLNKIDAVAVFIGPSPFGQWQAFEVQEIISKRLVNAQKKIIPIMLPGAKLNNAPPFLREISFVDLRDEIDKPEELKRFIDAILENKTSAGATFSNMATEAYSRGDYETALKYLMQSLKIRRELGEKSGEGTTLNNISQIYHARGDYETALKYLEQSLTIRREIGDKSGEAYTLFNMALTYIENINRPEEGKACLKTVLAINEKLKDARLAEALKGLFEI